MSSKPSQVADLLLAAGAAWLAARGHSPEAIADRAARAAEGIRTMRERLEQLGESQARAVAGCKLPDRCACLFCLDREQLQ